MYIFIIEMLYRHFCMIYVFVLSLYLLKETYDTRAEGHTRPSASFSF